MLANPPHTQYSVPLTDFILRSSVRMDFKHVDYLTVWDLVGMPDNVLSFADDGRPQ